MLIVLLRYEEVEAPPSSKDSYHVLSLADCIGPVLSGQ